VTAALETLLLPAETYERSDVELLQVFVLGVKIGSEVLWAPLIYQVVVAALLALARPKSWLRWVAVGMIAACRLGERLTGFPPASTVRLARLLRALDLPTAAEGFSPDAMIESMFGDKKTERGVLRFVLPRVVGSVEIVPVDDLELLREVLSSLPTEPSENA